MNSRELILPEGADLKFFRDHGWWISPLVLNEDLIDLLRYGIERFYAGERDFCLLIDVPSDWKPDDGHVLRQNDYVSRQVREIAEFVRHPQLPALAAALSETSLIRLFHDQVIYKPPRSKDTTVGWHNDRSYWNTCTSNNMITAWVPLDDITEDMGALTVIDQSHVWNVSEGLQTFRSIDDPRVKRLASEYGERWKPQVIELKAGQVSFHHCRTIHGSTANQSNKPRVAFAIHYQDAVNKYRLFFDQGGQRAVHLNDLLCQRDASGNPDYHDSNICPVLWPQKDDYSSAQRYT